MNEKTARILDRLFMAAMQRFRDPPAESRPGIEERFAALLDRFRRIAVPHGVFDESIKNRLLVPRPENFNEITVVMDAEMPGLPAPIPMTRPAVYHFHPVRGPVTASLVLIHGWRQPVLGLVGRFAKYCAARGIATATLELPGHINRRLRGRTTGEGFSSPEPEVLLPYLFHTVVEAEAARRLLAEIHPGKPAGILGVSLGGWLAALAGMVFEPDYLFLISPAVAPERVFQHSPIFARRRAEAERSEWGMEGFVEGIRQVSPMFSDPLIPGNAVRIMSGRYDEVIPYNDVLDFTRVWETQAIVPIEHGHFSMMYLYPDLFTDVCRELKKLINGLPHREQDE